MNWTHGRDDPRASLCGHCGEPWPCRGAYTRLLNAVKMLLDYDHMPSEQLESIHGQYLAGDVWTELQEAYSAIAEEPPA